MAPAVVGVLVICSAGAGSHEDRRWWCGIPVRYCWLVEVLVWNSGDGDAGLWRSRNGVRRRAISAGPRWLRCVHRSVNWICSDQLLVVVAVIILGWITFGAGDSGSSWSALPKRIDYWIGCSASVYHMIAFVRCVRLRRWAAFFIWWPEYSAKASIIFGEYREFWSEFSSNKNSRCELSPETRVIISIFRSDRYADLPSVERVESPLRVGRLIWEIVWMKIYL